MIELTTNILVEQKEISIFKTSITEEKEIQLVKNLLNLIVGANNWSFDLEDVDHILRIKANTIVNGFLSKELEKLSIECEELF